LERVAIAPVKIGIRYRTQLSRFPDREVKIAANISVGKINSDLTLSESFNWLRDHPKKIVEAQLVEQLKSWRQLNPSQIGELVYLLHRFGTEKMLVMLSPQRALYATQGPEFPREVYVTQAEIALLALSERNRGAKLGLGSDRALLQSFRAIVENKAIPETFAIRTVFDPQGGLQGYKNRSNWPELRLLATQLADRIENAAGGQGKGSKSKRLKVSGPELRRTAGVIRNWISKIEGSIKEDKTRGLKGKSVSISRGKRIAKKSTQRRTRS
jgi:hypothetical protein